MMLYLWWSALPAMSRSSSSSSLLLLSLLLGGCAMMIQAEVDHQEVTATARMSGIISTRTLSSPSPAGPNNIYNTASSSRRRGAEVYITNSGTTSTIRQDAVFTSTEKLQYNFIMMNGGSSFFDPVQVGWENTCRGLRTNCRYFKAPSENCSDWMISLLSEFAVQNDTLSGIAMAPCDIEVTAPVMRYISQEANIPIVLFDNDIPKEISGRSAYIGTDNAFLGITMANVLKQLRPEGGTFAILTAEGKDNLDIRATAFREEITKNNHDSSNNKAKWYELENSPRLGVGRDIFRAQDVMDLNPTAIIVMYQSPMRSKNWTDFIDSNRHRNVTVVGSDGSDYQIEYLNQRYVDGLVGQLPYDMGRVSLEVLHELALTGKLDQDSYGTNLVSYTLIPLELPELILDENLLGNLVYVGSICFAVVVLSAIISVGWTYYYREDLVVRAAQPFFLIMVAGGVILLSSTLVPLSFDDGGDPKSMSRIRSVGICMSIPWLAFTGFTVTFSALFSKTWRVNRLFLSKVRHARIQISEKDVLAPFAVLLTSNIIVLICWTIMDPLTYTREEHDGTDYWNRVISTYGACRSDNVVPYLTTLAVINFSVVAIACWQAFQARDIKSEFSEAKYIGSAVSSLFQGFLTGIPILIIVKDTPEAFYVILTLTIFLLCMAVLLLIFLPKVAMQRTYSVMSEAEQKRVMAEGIQQSSGFIGKSKSFSFSADNPPPAMGFNNSPPSLGFSSSIQEMAGDATYDANEKSVVLPDRNAEVEVVTIIKNSRPSTNESDDPDASEQLPQLPQQQQQQQHDGEDDGGLALDPPLDSDTVLSA